MGAWLYVALRYIHSFIHLTYNGVIYRIAVYVLSTVILFMLWGVFEGASSVLAQLCLQRERRSKRLNQDWGGRRAVTMRR